MAHTYLLFDFGTDEEKAQQARHKLESWKQAFRLDKKLQFKFDRGESGTAESASDAKPTAPKAVSKTEGKPKGRTTAKSESNEKTSENGGYVKLLVRLYFSGHEKLSEKQWLERIPGEEPFKAAAPKVVQEGETDFAQVLKQFDGLD
jgi:hypothetical protein